MVPLLAPFTLSPNLCAAAALLSHRARLLLTREFAPFPTPFGPDPVGLCVCLSADAIAGRERRSVAEHIQCALLFLGTRVIIKRSDGRTMPPLLRTNLAQQQQQRRTLVAISTAAFIKRENWPPKESCCALRTTQ
jgi:hypothetical protein